jgi:rSAM/selenodomain-associated transferase 1
MTYSATPAASSLVIFARAPELGRCKTRLASKLGEVVALDLYTAFLEDVCALSRGVAERRILAVAGSIANPVLMRLGERFGLELVPQPEGDLGVRMHLLLQTELISARRVCLIGSDSPTLPQIRLQEAFDALDGHDVVVGPSTDGGYWLLGARKWLDVVFEDIPWSSPAVLPKTLERLAGHSVALLPFFYDVDEPADLALLSAHLLHLPKEVAAATRRALGRCMPNWRLSV